MHELDSFMNAEWKSETTTFHCWLNLVTGVCQWRVMETGECHGPEHPTVELAQAWFNNRGGIRALHEERRANVPPKIKDLLAIEQANNKLSC